VLSGRGFWDELITRPEESYRLWCVVVCDIETLRMRRPWPTGGCRAKIKSIGLVIIVLNFIVLQYLELSIVELRDRNSITDW